MAIRFSCPNCGKALVVKDQLAGKRGACSGCKKVITIPAPVAEAHHEDVEALAREAFADDPAVAAEVQMVEFECPMCAEMIKVPADVQGKRAPCPVCTRIIKVPELVKHEPTDWRTLKARGPSGARQTVEAAHEEGWRSASTAGVSRETLVQAGAIAEVADQDAARQRWMRITQLAIAVFVLALGGLFAYRFVARGKADKYLERALELARGDAKLTPEQTAAVHWAAGEYYARADRPDAATKASEELGQARGALAKATSLERDAMLADLALVQLDLGGDKAEAGKGRALEWGDAVGAVRQTLEQIHAPEARIESLRQVIRGLLAKGQVRAAQSLAGRLGGAGAAPGGKPGQVPNDTKDLVAVTALELLHAKQPKEAQGLADMIFPPAGPAAKDKKDNKVPNTPVTVPVVALAVFLGREEPKPRTTGKKDEEKVVAEDVESIMLGKAEGLAYRGEFAAARDLLNSLPPPIRLRGLITLAGLAAENNAPDTADLNAAVNLAEGEGKGQDVSPWVQLRLCQLAVQAGMADRVQQLANQIKDNGLKGQAQLAVVKARLRASKEGVEDTLAGNVAEKTGAAAQAREALARHNARFDSGTAKAVEGWSEADRAAGFAGVALGMQDKQK